MLPQKIHYIPGTWPYLYVTTGINRCTCDKLGSFGVVSAFRFRKELVCWHLQQNAISFIVVLLSFVPECMNGVVEFHAVISHSD